MERVREDRRDAFCIFEQYGGGNIDGIGVGLGYYLRHAGACREC